MLKNRSSRLFFAATVCAALVACGGGGGDSTATTPTVVPVPAAVTSFFTAFDASRATAIAPTGAAFFAMYDGCYFDNGRSKTSSVAEFDADSQSVDASKFRIASTRTALKVLADRSTTNPDGSSRRELDIQYDINFADGTVDHATTATLLYGSSAGSTLPGGTACTSAENKLEWRFYGNRKVVSTSITARTERLERYNLADGSPLANPVAYSKYISLTVEDPGRYASYATISSPGLPIVLKLLSPRVLRDDPLLVGKRGNYVDARDSQSFGVCRSASGNYEQAALADCVQFGASGNGWGAFNYPVAADADLNFDNPALVAGGVYTINVYNDDGWKTVNGQAGKTPIATYTATLNRLPYSAAALAGAGGGSELFPRFVSLTKTKVEIAAAIRQKLLIAIDAVWSAPGTMPDARKLGWGSVYAYESGRANVVAADFPASRNTTYVYPAAGATQARLPSPTAGPLLVTPTYSEIALFYSNRDGNTVSSLLAFY